MRVESSYVRFSVFKMKSLEGRLNSVNQKVKINDFVTLHDYINF